MGDIILTTAGLRIPPEFNYTNQSEHSRGIKSLDGDLWGYTTLQPTSLWIDLMIIVYHKAFKSMCCAMKAFTNNYIVYLKWKALLNVASILLIPIRSYIATRGIPTADSVWPLTCRVTGQLWEAVVCCQPGMRSRNRGDETVPTVHSSLLPTRYQLYDIVEQYWRRNNV